MQLRDPTQTPTRTTAKTPTAPTRTSSRSSTPVPEKPGTVESYIGYASVIAHDATLAETEDGERWVVWVRLRLDVQDPEVTTPRAVGVFFVFLDAEGDELYQVHEQAPANTGDGPDTATLSALFEPSRVGRTQADQVTFHEYRIELVHL